MNKLDTKTRAQILHMLVEGTSMRAISRMTGVSINTVTKLLVDAGKTCIVHHSRTVQNVAAKRVQCDVVQPCQGQNVKTAGAAPAWAGFTSAW